MQKGRTMTNKIRSQYSNKHNPQPDSQQAQSEQPKFDGIKNALLQDNDDMDQATSKATRQQLEKQVKLLNSDVSNLKASNKELVNTVRKMQQQLESLQREVGLFRSWSR